MSLTSIVRAMVSSGATPEMILAVVEAEEKDRSIQEEEKLAKAAERQRRYRESRHVTSRNVTQCDTPTPPLVPPSDGFPDPSFTPPYNPPVTPVVVHAAKKLRGTRLPPEWELSDEEGEWAEKEFHLPAKEIILEAEKFKDYWHARAGPGAVKLNWTATWRNWIRKALEGKNNGVQGQKKYG